MRWPVSGSAANLESSWIPLFQLPCHWEPLECCGICSFATIHSAQCQRHVCSLLKPCSCLSVWGTPQVLGSSGGAHPLNLCWLTHLMPSSSPSLAPAGAAAPPRPGQVQGTPPSHAAAPTGGGLRAIARRGGSRATWARQAGALGSARVLPAVAPCVREPRKCTGSSLRGETAGNQNLLGRKARKSLGIFLGVVWVGP